MAQCFTRQVHSPSTHCASSGNVLDEDDLLFSEDDSRVWCPKVETPSSGPYVEDASVEGEGNAKPRNDGVKMRTGKLRCMRRDISDHLGATPTKNNFFFQRRAWS